VGIFIGVEMGPASKAPKTVSKEKNKGDCD